MSEVLGSFSADPAALFTVNKNLVTNELSLAFQKDGNPICFLFLAIPTKFASMRKWPRVRTTCTRAYTREVRSPSLAKCGGWGKEIRKFWSAFENIQTIVKYDFLNIFKHLKVFVLNLENFKLVCFLQI